MSDTTRLSVALRPAAYVATIDALPCGAVHQTGLTMIRPRALDALNGLPVPITFTSPSRFTPLEQAQLAIQGAAAAFLPKLGLSAVLWQERESGEVAGDLSVWHEGRFRPIATVTVVPAQRQARAA